MWDKSSQECHREVNVSVMGILAVSCYSKSEVTQNEWQTVYVDGQERRVRYTICVRKMWIRVWNVSCCGAASKKGTEWRC